MPTYNFVCNECGHSEDIYLHMSEYDAEIKCQSCKKRHMTRLVGAGMPPKISGTENPYKGK